MTSIPRTDADALAALLLAAAVYCFFMLLGRSVLGDPDIYWHIETGRWILAHGAIPAADPFSHTLRGTEWVAWEWLADVVYAIAFGLAGWPGVLSLSVAALALAFAMQMRFLCAHLRTITALEIVVVAVMLIAGHALARPHALAYPMLVAWCAGLVRAADEGRPPSFWLVPLMLVWANVHPSFVFGLAFTAPMTLEAVLDAPPATRRRTVLTWGAFALAACVAACLTPRGPYLFFDIARTLAMNRALSFIAEWQPASFAQISVLELALLASMMGALSLGIRLPPVRTVVLLGLLHMALVHVRHTSLLALVAPLLLARPVGQQLGKLAPCRTVPGHFAAAALIAAALPALAVTLRPIEPPDAITPRVALAAITATTGGAILNDYQFGGYLIFAGIAPSIDSRADMYGDPFIVRYYHMLRAGDAGALRQFLEEHRIAATLLIPDTPAVALLDRMPDWRRVHADSVAIAHARR